MNTRDELLDLKVALQAMERSLARRDARALHEQQRAGAARLQWGLWPLWLGQTLQIGFGLLCIALGASEWSALRDGSAIFYSALVVHGYGVACIVLAGLVLGRLARIDRSEALLLTQTRLAKLRRTYIVAGMAIGLPWWLLWLPFMATLFHWLARANLYANLGAPTVIVMIAIGVVGLLGSWVFHHWSRSAARPRLAAAMERAVTGHSLSRAQRQLDELRAFADES